MRENKVPHQQLLEFLLRNINSGSLLTDEKPNCWSMWETVNVWVMEKKGADVCLCARRIYMHSFINHTAWRRWGYWNGIETGFAFVCILDNEIDLNFREVTEFTTLGRKERTKLKMCCCFFIWFFSNCTWFVREFQSTSAHTYSCMWLWVCSLFRCVCVCATASWFCSVITAALPAQQSSFIKQPTSPDSTPLCVCVSVFVHACTCVSNQPRFTAYPLIHHVR